MESRAEHFETITGVVTEKPFGHLATRHIARADNQDSLFIHSSQRPIVIFSRFHNVLQSSLWRFIFDRF
jgi:hypothetical protein